MGTGDYRITLVVGGTSVSKVLRVEDTGIGGRSNVGMP